MMDIENELQKLNEYHEQIATHDAATQVSKKQEKGRLQDYHQGNRCFYQQMN